MKIAIVDIETTAFQPQHGSIVEIGIVELNLETGERKVLYDELVRENSLKESDSKEWIFHNSDLKFEDVWNAKSLNIESLQKIFDEYPATAYNKVFDFNFLKHRGLKIKELPCPMITATNICKLPSIHGYNSYKWPKFQEAHDFFFPDEEYVEAHRGGDDAMYEAKVVYEMYRMGYYKVNMVSINGGVKNE